MTRLHRCFLWNGSKSLHEMGGPLYVPRTFQGAGRFDIPHKDGVLYASKDLESTVAEHLQGFRGLSIDDRYFKNNDGFKYSLAELIMNDGKLIDLDDPGVLNELKIKPSQYLTSDRKTTQAISGKIYDEGYDGFFWCSALDGAWTNATLFGSRALEKLSCPKKPVPMNTRNETVQTICKKFSISLGK